jgi:hypothetical protein
MDLALHADMMTSTSNEFFGPWSPEDMETWIKGWSEYVQNKHAELKFGFPNEHTMASGAYRACWDGKLEIGISPDYTFFIWRSLEPSRLRHPRAGEGSQLTDLWPHKSGRMLHKLGTVRVNCDGLLHALALIHHLLQEHGIEQPIT